MALPPALERGTSQTPEIKLTHQLTGDEVHEIARRTGGVVKYSTSLRTYYGEMGGTAPARVKYPTLNAEINFVGYPTEVIYQMPGVYLNVDGEDCSISKKQRSGYRRRFCYICSSSRTRNGKTKRKYYNSYY